MSDKTELLTQNAVPCEESDSTKEELMQPTEESIHSASTRFSFGADKLRELTGMNQKREESNEDFWNFFAMNKMQKAFNEFGDYIENEYQQFRKFGENMYKKEVSYLSSFFENSKEEKPVEPEKDAHTVRKMAIDQIVNRAMLIALEDPEKLGSEIKISEYWTTEFIDELKKALGEKHFSSEFCSSRDPPCIRVMWA